MSTTNSFRHHPIETRNRAYRRLWAVRQLHFTSPRHLYAIFVNFRNRVGKRGNNQTVILQPIGLGPAKSPQSRRPRRHEFGSFVIVGGVTLFRFVPHTVRPATRFQRSRRFSMIIFRPRHLPKFRNFLLTRHVNRTMKVGHTKQSLVGTVFRRRKVCVLQPNFVNQSLGTLLPRFC